MYIAAWKYPDAVEVSRDIPMFLFQDTDNDDEDDDEEEDKFIEEE